MHFNPKDSGVGKGGTELQAEGRSVQRPQAVAHVDPVFCTMNAGMCRSSPRGLDEPEIGCEPLFRFVSTGLTHSCHAPPAGSDSGGWKPVEGVGGEEAERREKRGAVGGAASLSQPCRRPRPPSSVPRAQPPGGGTGSWPPRTFLCVNGAMHTAERHSA